MTGAGGEGGPRGTYRAGERKGGTMRSGTGKKKELEIERASHLMTIISEKQSYRSAVRIPPGYLSVDLEPRGRHGILLGLHHADDALLGPGVVLGSLLAGRVPNVLSGGGFVGGPDRHGGADLGVGQLFQRQPRGLRGFLDFVLVGTLEGFVVFVGDLFREQIREFRVDDLEMRYKIINTMRQR